MENTTTPKSIPRDQSPTTVFDLKDETAKNETNKPTQDKKDDTSKPSLPSKLLKSLTTLTLSLLYFSYLFTRTCLYYRNTYIEPLLTKTGQTFVHEELDYEYNNKHGGMTYFLRECDSTDLTAHSQDEVTYTKTKHTQQDFVEMIMRHGAGIMPDMLTSNTTSELRNVILKMNEATSFDKMFSLKEHGQRWSLRLNPYDGRLDPDRVIQKALREVADHEVVKKSLEDILGPDPAMVELAAITSTPGALVQDWHCDTWFDASHLSHARTYGAVYSLFFYLQDTYVDMGVTGLCLGSHTCSGMNDVDQCLFPTFRAGTMAILNSQLYHQGSGNTAFHREDGTRVMFIITFSSRPRPDDPRVLPSGSVYGIPWYVWGNNLHDYHKMQYNNWISSALQSIGLYNIGKNDGISFVMGTSMARAENFNAGNEDEWFLEEEVWEEWSGILLKANIIALVCYVTLTLVISIYHYLKHKSLSTYSHLKTLLKFYTTTTLLLYLFFTQLYPKTKFVQRITSPNFQNLQLFTPSTEEQLSPEYIESITIPIYSDVIYGDKLNAYYTYYNTFYYDYHPGNREYRDLLKREIDFEWNEHFPLKELFIKGIQSRLESDYFLRQNEYGHWSIMSQNDILKSIDEDIYNMQCPIVRMLLKEIEFMISQCVYGDGGRTYLGVFADKDTSMARYLLQFVEGLKGRIRLASDGLAKESRLQTRDFSDMHTFKIKMPQLSTNPYKTPTTLLKELKSINQDYSKHIDPTVSIPATTQIKSLLESKKYGILQNITVGGYTALQQSINYMKNLPYELVDDEWMDRVEYENVLNILRNCKNMNEYCSHWASFGYCENEEHRGFLERECRPACGFCHLMFE